MTAFLTIFSLYFIILLVKFIFSLNIPDLYFDYEKKINLNDVTIMQPILSGDPTLEETLKLNLVENPNVNFLWLIDEDDIAAQEITNKLKLLLNTIKIDILKYEPCPDKINPKVFKLNKGFTNIKTNSVIILDDDAYLPKETLKNLISNLEKYDLTTGLPFYKDDGNFWSKIMTQFVNNNSAMTYLPLLWMWSPLSINGMCYAMKINTINSLNNFEDILSYLADDLSLALVLKNKKMTIFQSREPVLLQTNLNNATKYMNLMHRWFLFAKLLLNNHLPKYNLVISLLHGLPPIFLWSLLVMSFLNIKFLPVVLFLFVCRYFIIMKIHKSFLKSNQFHKPLHSIIAELLQPIHLIHALVKNTIIWRTHKYKVISNEEFFEV